jgi:glycosyltransferase involved in cell wall biosynthesis
MRFLFVTAMTGYPWAGSEELWGRAAMHLAGEGHEVSALVPRWPRLAAPLERLEAAGATVRMRAAPRSGLVQRVSARLGRVFGPREPEDFRWMREQRPDLVCVSNGNYFDGLAYLEFCAAAGIPFASIVQANGEFLWPHDDLADRILAAYARARRTFFVSHANRELMERHLGAPIEASDVVRNPFNTAWEAPADWPAEDGGTRLACVARYDPSAKGQDLLFAVLAAEPWRSRPVTLSLYGAGPMERSMRRQVSRHGLDATVTFRGHVDDIRGIWRDHHALVLPSRYEGLPLALVEAMICGRPSIVTDVAGNAELLEDGVTGFVAEAATARHLGAALERAWARRDDWRTIGAAAREAVQRQVPDDPPRCFARRLVAVASGADGTGTTDRREQA